MTVTEEDIRMAEERVKETEGNVDVWRRTYQEAREKVSLCCGLGLR